MPEDKELLFPFQFYYVRSQGFYISVVRANIDKNECGTRNESSCLKNGKKILGTPKK